jgi:hypothetical protein
MKRRDLLKLIAISPLTRALQAGTIKEVPPIKEGEIDVTRLLLTDTEVLQFRAGETKAFDIPKCKSLSVYAEEENKGAIFFGAEKTPETDGMKLEPGRQYIAKNVPAATLYAVGISDDLMIVTFTSG